MLRAKVALGMPRNSATAIGSVPVYPSVDSTPPITRSNSPRLMAAARTLAVTNVSAPGRAASVISTPLWAPIDRARRMAASAGSGPMLRTDLAARLLGELQRRLHHVLVSGVQGSLHSLADEAMVRRRRCSS